MTLRYLHYDVFTREPLLGNQLAVFHDLRGLDDGVMQRIAREMSFSESTFIFQAEQPGTDVRMRIFTPGVELPIAGHPTVGSTFALAALGMIAPGTPRFVFGLNIGAVPVDLEWADGRLSFVWMTQPNPTFAAPLSDRSAAAKALGLTAADLAADLPVQVVSCGVPYLLVPLASAEAVDRAVSDASALRSVAGSAGVYLFALDDGATPVTGEPVVTPVVPVSPVSIPPVPTPPIAPSVPVRPAVGVWARMFAPQIGITEDPATGSACGPLGCYLVEHGVVSGAAAREIVCRQGVAMGRASRIRISIEGGPGAIREVKVGGEAVLVGRGELMV